CYQDIQLPPTF
nr:immunoglobulin light chain junction region [Macaca mulatta]